MLISIGVEAVEECTNSLRVSSPNSFAMFFGAQINHFYWELQTLHQSLHLCIFSKVSIHCLYCVSVKGQRFFQNVSPDPHRTPQMLYERSRQCSLISVFGRRTGSKCLDWNRQRYLCWS